MLRFKPYHLLATIQIPTKLEITNVARRLKGSLAYERLRSRWRVFNRRNRLSLRVQQQFPIFRRHVTFPSEYIVPVGPRTELGSE